MMTPRRVIASNVSGPTNFVADRVITAATSWPRFCSPRATSTALYAPIPPVTPRAISATAVASLSALEFLDLAFLDFLLRQLHELLAARRFWRAPIQQLAGTRPCHHYELEPSRRFSTMCHAISLSCYSRMNVLTMPSAAVRIDRKRARSARTIDRRRSTHASSSSLTTT